MTPKWWFLMCLVTPQLFVFMCSFCIEYSHGPHRLNPFTLDTLASASVCSVYTARKMSREIRWTHSSSQGDKLFLFCWPRVPPSRQNEHILAPLRVRAFCLFLPTLWCSWVQYTLSRPGATKGGFRLIACLQEPFQEPTSDFGNSGTLLWQSVQNVWLRSFTQSAARTGCHMNHY